MDALNFNEDDLSKERSAAGGGADEDEDEYLEDELQQISEKPDACQPPGHVIMPGILKYAQGKAREDACETAMELSFLNDSKSDATCKKRPCYPMNIEKHQESLNRAYGDYVKSKKFQESKKRVKDFENYLSHKGKCHNDSIRSEGGTPKAFREKLIEFMSDGKLDKIVNAAPIDFSHRLDPNVNPVLNDPKLQLIVEDSYFPGIIDDAVNRKLDFNSLSFDMTFGPDGAPEEVEPENVPPTLLQSFEKRIDLENAQRRERLKQEEDRAPELKQDCCKMGGFLQFLKQRNESHKVARDETILSTAVDVDLNASLRTTPENDLTRAITCLQRAQMMNTYDKSIQIAELAYVQAPDDLAETAAIIKANSFIAHVSEQRSVESSGQYKPIEIVSYLGVTEPLPGDLKIPKALDLKVGLKPDESLPTPKTIPKPKIPPPKAMGSKLPSKRPLAAMSALKATKAAGSCDLPSKPKPSACSIKSKPSSSTASSRLKTSAIPRASSSSRPPATSGSKRSGTFTVKSADLRPNLVRPNIAAPAIQSKIPKVNVLKTSGIPRASSSSRPPATSGAPAIQSKIPRVNVLKTSGIPRASSSSRPPATSGAGTLTGKSADLRANLVTPHIATPRIETILSQIPQVNTSKYGYTQVFPRNVNVEYIKGKCLKYPPL